MNCDMDMGQCVIVLGRYAGTLLSSWVPMYFGPEGRQEGAGGPGLIPAKVSLRCLAQFSTGGVHSGMPFYGTTM